MAVSLEVRAPILDHKFMEFVATISPGMKARGLKGKYIFKKAMSKIVPPETLNRSKMGFGVPMTDWLKSDLKETVETELFGKGGITGELFDLEYVRQMWSTVLHHRINGLRKTDFSYRVWVLFMFSRWFRTYISA